MNRSTSIKNASRVRRKVKMLNMNTPKRYRGECEGEWKCAVMAKMSIISVNRAATGWMMRIADKVFLADEGTSKLELSVVVRRVARF